MSLPTHRTRALAPQMRDPRPGHELKHVFLGRWMQTSLFTGANLFGEFAFGNLCLRAKQGGWSQP